MKTKRRDTKGNNKKNSNFFTSVPFIAFTVVIIGALLFFLWHQRTLQQTEQQQEIYPQDLAKEIAVPEQVGSDSPSVSSQNTALADDNANDKESFNDIQKDQQSFNLTGDGSKLQEEQNTENVLKNQQTSTADTAEHASVSGPSSNSNKKFQSARCQETTLFIEEFFKHLDKQQYLAKYDIQPDSKTYFIDLMQKILDNPPVVSGETDDLYTILQNTAHFFRIIGNSNIVILKNILSNEKAQFEDIAAKFYSLITSQECAKHSFGLDISKPALYEYAGFFLNTMGGRLYLFRRDSISRMVISYYSILLIDRANIESFNKHGIELSTSIDLLISEMESTTNTLRLKDVYLNTLYALQEQYQ